VNVRVYGPNGDPLPNQDIVIRPTATTLGKNPESNLMERGKTDSGGLFSNEAIPGEYTIATLIEEKPFETSLHIPESNRKCATNLRKCRDVSHRIKPPELNMEAHLTTVIVECPDYKIDKSGCPRSRF
jgi:hypothetical protein